MSKQKRIIWIAAIAAGAYYFVLRNAKALILTIRSWKFSRIDVNSGRVYINLNLKIQNPLKVGMTLRGVHGDVFINGILAGRIDNEYKFYLASNTTSVLPVQVGLDTSLLTEALLHGLQNGENISLAFNGNMYIGSLRVAVPVQIEYKTDGE